MDTSYSENPSMWKNNPLGVILCIILVPAFGLGLLILLVWYISCKSMKLEVTGREVVLEQGLLSKNRTEVSVSRIRTVKVSQSLLNRMFRVGKIELFTAGDTPEIVASGMPNPNAVREMIRARQAA